jgi:hypothetical protein
MKYQKNKNADEMIRLRLGIYHIGQVSIKTFKHEKF